MSQFQKYFERLEVPMDKFKILPQVERFIKEALEMNSNLTRQQETFCQKISNTSCYCDTSKTLIEKVANRRLECENIEKKVTEFI